MGSSDSLKKPTHRCKDTTQTCTQMHMGAHTQKPNAYTNKISKRKTKQRRHVCVYDLSAIQKLMFLLKDVAVK